MPENIPALDAQAITLREHLEGRISALASSLTDAIRSAEEGSVERQAALRREIELVQESTKEAVDKAERSMNERLKGMNEFRDTLRDQASKFVTVVQLDDRMETALSLTGRVEERLRDLERNVTTRDMLDATIKERENTQNALSDRITRVEKFMWVLMGAFILLQIIAPYLRAVATSK